MRLIVAGGGTGGHIYPALAVAKWVLRDVPGSSVLYVGSRKGLEAGIVPKEGIPFEAITVSGLARKSLLRRIGSVGNACLGLYQSAGIIRRFRPDVVLGTGGYVSGPVVLASVMLGIPTALQEQNVFPGMTTRLLARFARVAFVPFEETCRHLPRNTRTVVTGNPVRPEVLSCDRDRARQRFGLQPDDKLVLIFGGSRGAATINRAAIDMIRILYSAEPSSKKMDRAKILFVTGETYYSEAKRLLDSFFVRGMGQENYGNIMIEPYLFEMEEALAAADLVVCRAGAMTLAEIAARGLPAILIPSPNVVHDHQGHNARVFQASGAAIVIDDEEANGEKLAGAIWALVEDEVTLAKLRERSKSLGKPDATRRIVDELVLIARSKAKPVKPGKGRGAAGRRP